jgi:exopolysaccharide biosynthesis polyprenyl glycosylphosphotransferase
MFRERAKTLQGISLALDVSCICLAFAAAFVLRIFHNHIPILSTIPAEPWNAENLVRSDYALLLALSTVAWIVSLRTSGVYMSDRSEHLLSVLGAYVRALALASLATGAAIFILKMQSVSRVFVGYYFSFAFGLLAGKQLAVITILRQLRRSEFRRRHALVIGAGRPASWFARVLLDSSSTGYDLVGLLLTRNVISAETSSVPVIGTLEDLDRILADQPVDEVFIVGGASELAELAPVAQTLIERGRVVSLITPLASGQHGVRGRVTEFNGIPALSFGPMPKDEVALGINRALDVAVAAAALVVLSPVMTVVSILLKILDPGPILFRQERLGQCGRSFLLYKFRSMRVDAERLLRADGALYRRYVENDYKLPEAEDPRISPLGRFLRKTSLDELPQLWNVIKGDMALVGPRPIVPAEREKYEPYVDLLLAVRPGLTGLWQVNGRSAVRYPARAFMDFDYVAARSLRGDLALLARTGPSVLMGRGAH